MNNDENLNELINFLKESVEFGQQEIPLIAQQYLDWCYYSSLIGVIFWLLFIILIWVVLYYVSRD